ncbi:hypothetical protein, partial [Streptomyces acidiscabies]|uniref:hypothetical protein n=1 Tax=Streptomyces acidiscabies TaxID=42234 RepID=UPI001F382679
HADQAQASGDAVRRRPASTPYATPAIPTTMPTTPRTRAVVSVQTGVRCRGRGAGNVYSR